MKTSHWSWTARFMLLAILVGCSDPATSQPSGLKVTKMSIGSKNYDLEIAADEESREHGLMERDTLAADHGMIFVFDKPEKQSFWMHHTRFPLDILFLDEKGKVVSIHHMKAYDESSTPSGKPAQYAIELHDGEAVACGVKENDTLKIPDEAKTK